MPTISEILAEAKARQSAGDLQNAVLGYRHLLSVDATHVETHYLLATAYHGLGHVDAAIACLAEAVRLDPEFADAHDYLGAALAQKGRLDEAISSFEQALRLQPLSHRISDNLRHARAAKDNSAGNALAARGNLEQAVACYRRALELKPDFAEAHNNLGLASADQGKLDEAAACCRRALALNPDFAEAHNNLGAVVGRQEKWDEAVACFRRAMALKPDYANAHVNLANALTRQEKLDEAAACCRRALELNPRLVSAHNSLAIVLRDQNQLDEAVARCRQALELNPNFAEARGNLGAILARQERFDEAVVQYRTALRLKPDFAEARNNLGMALLRQGQSDAAWACFRQAVETQSSYAVAHSNALLAMQYLPGVTPTELAAAHREFDARHAAPLRSAWRSHANVRDPGRRLRLGFVSADFAIHPVGSFLIRVLENLDKDQSEIYCYSDRRNADSMTDRLRTATAKWRDVRALSDCQLADQIRADRIDILFDLSGHTANNRLLMFARKPAPVAITWIGYVATTGLASIDYLLADRYEVPTAVEPYIVERVLRMPDGYVCFDPPGDAPLVSALPSVRRGYVSFGCFNNPAKISPPVVDLWAKLLRRVSAARLVLKYRGLDDASVTRRFIEMFSERGIDSGRIDVRGCEGHADLLRAYEDVDIALDPFPYSGGVTTCEALWMGVPVVTCPRETFASRHSFSHLSNVGLTETIATDLAEYVELAAGLAADLPRLAKIRASLRPRMAASPLCDGPQFSRNLMKVLRQVWRDWCVSSHEPGGSNEPGTAPAPGQNT